MLLYEIQLIAVPSYLILYYVVSDKTWGTIQITLQCYRKKVEPIPSIFPNYSKDLMVFHHKLWDIINLYTFNPYIFQKKGLLPSKVTKPKIDYFQPQSLFSFSFFLKSFGNYKESCFFPRNVKVQALTSFLSNFT